MFKKLFAFVVVVVLVSSGLVAQDDGQPQLYFFTNPGCGPCKQVKPEINLLISKGYPVTIVDTTQRPDIAQQFRVDRTPVTLLVSNNQIAGRKAGYVDARTIVGWFDSARATETKAVARDSKTGNGVARPLRATRSDASKISSTVHRGTRQPSGQTEYNAMRATVRLKVEDPEGISFATGTVIHSNNGESLVLTCGHVFREVGNRGKVTADIGFEGNETKTVPGKLVSYNSGSKDIALVVIQPGFDIPSVSVAPRAFQVSDGDQVFTLGCDHGEDATIRRTRIKRQAFYSSPETPNVKAKKYDIFGRPVDGRSGGGMFTAGGQLIGVCNAAAVEVDEGVYTALDNIHWQLAQVNLSHLFQPEQAIARLESNPPAENTEAQRVRPLNRPNTLGVATRPVSRLTQPSDESEDTQVIVILQSKSNPGQTETLIIEHPTTEFLEQLRAEQDGGFDNRIAQLRKEMPVMQKPGNSQQIRAQSPR
jgi:thiol-disulfide isomerase/thioredoxin